MGLFRCVLAIVLLPLAFGMSLGLYDTFVNVWPSCCIFLLGIISYTLIFPVFNKPLRSYILGHELTHVLSVWLFRGKIHKMSISRRGGVVKTDKTNIWIKLAPYFFLLH